MIKKFVKAWDKNKDSLERFIGMHRQKEYSSYEELVKLLFDIVINPELDRKYDTSDMHVIDDGAYQGTLVFILHTDAYQPSIGDYICTNNFYGSCSGCDTLQGISGYDYSSVPDDGQLKDYMALFLDLLQSCSYMYGGNGDE